jgi:hypothetical protein
MKRVGGSILTTGLVAVLSSCYPGEISNVGETDLITTGARPEYPFAKKTYFMPDTVFYIQSDSMAPDTFDHAFDSDILASVRTGLSGHGYTELPESADPETADLLVLNAVAINVNVSIWTWWPGYYPPYWGCCYGGYPWWPVTGGTVWRSGTVVTLMKDPSLEVVGDDGGEVWAGLMNGLAEGSEASTRSRITSGIAQAFSQSPYLAGGTPAPN